jgi:two-component system, NtrC family, sensor kinase
MASAGVLGAKRYVGRLVALAFGIGGLAVLEVWRSFDQATSAAERSITGIVRLLAEQTERTIQAIDFTLIGMRDALQVAPNLPPDDPAYRATMRHRLGRLPYVRALYVIGPDGFIMHDTDYPETPRVSLADRPYFQAHQQDPSLGLHIGQPLRSLSVGNWFVSFSRRITNADGSFGGIVVAAVEPRYFKHFYEGISIGENDLIALLLADGTLLARTPDHDGTIGTSYADSPVFKLALEKGSGVEWSASWVDGITRMIGYRKLAGPPIVVIAGWSEGRVYESWAEHAVILCGGSILVWSLAAGLALLSLRYRRREQQERARLAQVRRLEMMGRIAGGIAHDLGNTIRIARTTFSLLKPSLTSQQDALALVDDADRSLRSAFDIVERLLAFARRQELSPRPTDLGELIAGFLPILRQAAGPRIELAVDVARPLVCLIDPIHLESALLNLVLNSKDAMPEGGNIAIEVREAEPPRNSRIRRGGKAGAVPWAQIVVRDDGSGMSREVQERAFEPFFTTRTGGNGLGLSQVLGFVQQSAGDVQIASTEGAGTTVTLLFPTTAAPLAQASPPSSPTPAAETGGV